MMEQCRRMWLVTVMGLWLVAGFASESRAVEVGSSEAAVEAELGAPRNSIRSGDKTMLLYGGGTVEIVGGRVSAVNGTPQPHQDKRPARSGGAAAAKPAAAEKVKEDKPAAKAGAGDITDYRDGGKAMDLAKILVRGKTTVLVFYADWCPACRQAMPQLEALAADNAFMALRKVNIDRWDTPVTKKFGVSSIPNMRVFDREGRQLGEPTSSIERVRKLVEDTRKK